MKKPYFENLDALRFLAFLSVFLFHSFYTPFDAIKTNSVYQVFHFATRNGELGVNFFFVLSGFLISYLLLAEEANTGTVDVFRFYIRRMLRIWPVYLLITLVCFLAYPHIRQLFGDNPQPETSNPLLFFTFLSNYDNIYNHSQTPSLYILWSVSIEEQFYLLWPLLMALFPFQRKWIPIATVVALNVISRVYFRNDDLHLRFDSLCVTSDMAVGALLAWFAFARQHRIRHLDRMKKKYAVAGYCAGLLLIFTRCYWTQVVCLRILERLILSGFFAFVIANQTLSANPVFRAGKIKWMTALGKKTYGLYCYHYLCLLFAVKLNAAFRLNQTVFGVVVLDNLLALAVAIVAASLSYKYFEARFLKLKSSFDYRLAGARPEAVPAMRQNLK